MPSGIFLAIYLKTNFDNFCLEASHTIVFKTALAFFHLYVISLGILSALCLYISVAIPLGISQEIPSNVA